MAKSSLEAALALALLVAACASIAVVPQPAAASQHIAVYSVLETDAGIDTDPSGGSFGDPTDGEDGDPTDGNGIARNVCQTSTADLASSDAVGPGDGAEAMPTIQARGRIGVFDLALILTCWLLGL